MPLGEPYHAYQRSPSFALKMSDVTSYLRFDGVLAKRFVELATITIGRFWSAEIVFASHAPAAVAAGIDNAIVEAMRHNKTPEFDQPDEAAVYNFTIRLPKLRLRRQGCEAAPDLKRRYPDIHWVRRRIDRLSTTSPAAVKKGQNFP